MSTLLHCRLPLLLLAVLTLAHPTWADEGPKGGPEEFKHLQYRLIGPFAGGRVSRAAGVPGDPRICYFAAARSGVWKSTDGGILWKPIFDDQPDSSIGSLAIAPSDPNVVYVGAGEANIRGNVGPGHGIYKSTDAGKTWQHVWKQEGQIGQMIVHPENPNVAYAAVLGHAFGPNTERGVYRTTDGGRTWQQVLRKDADTGASDVCLDPHNPRVLFAGLWQARRKPWEMTSGGPGSGLYASRDGGDTWTQLVPPPAPDSPDAGKDAPTGKQYASGLPEGIWGKVAVAVAPSDGRRVYALIEAEKGGLFRSDNGGDTWKLINDHRALRQRAWYFTTLTVDPTNPDIVWVPQVPLLKSIDGGKNFARVKGPHHGDHHDLWIDPKDPKRIIDSNDGGVDVSVNGGETWYAAPLPIAQFYHINVDNRVPYHVLGNMQDLGTASGPSNSLSSAGIRLGDWHMVGGGETGFAVPAPDDPNIVYAGEYGGYISRYDHRTRQAKNVGIYPVNPSGHGAEALRYRFQWTAPILVSRSGGVVYHGGNHVFRSRDGGQSWEKVSPDLTRNDKSKQQWSGGPITGDNTGAEYYGTIFALAESPLPNGPLWAGSDDGLVHVSRDGGQSWVNVTPHIRGLPEWGTVTCIEASPFDSGTAYVTVDAHRLDDMRPYLFKTTDYGQTWKGLATSLPTDSYLHVVREDPERRGLLYLGTERGVYFSLDDGETWRLLRLNLPTVAVTDLKVKDGDLVVGTNGRSIWALDDLTPLRRMSADVQKQDAFLFPPRNAIRYRHHGDVQSKLNGPDAGKNPPPGAVIDYFLAARPKGEITLDIVDADGKPVETLTSKEEPPPPDDLGAYSSDPPKKTRLTTHAGVNRIVWDLRYAPPTVIKEARVDGGEPRIGPLANPGRYTLKLIVDGKALTRRLEVVPDPRTQRSAAEQMARANGSATGSGADGGSALAEQLKLTLQIREDISRLAATVEALRSVRKQLTDRNGILGNDPRVAGLVKASSELIGKLDELEAKLHNPRAKVSYDILALRGGAQLYSQLVWLFETLKDADGAPTQGVREVYAEQAEIHTRLEKELARLIAEDLARLNNSARGLDLPGIIVPPARAGTKAAAAETTDPNSYAGILREVEIPSIRPVADAQPASASNWSEELRRTYHDDGKMTPLRVAVARARKQLLDQIRKVSLPDTFRTTALDDRFLESVRKLQVDKFAIPLTLLSEALAELDEVRKDREDEPLRRWQAQYDFVRARLSQQIAYLYEYQSALGELRREPPRFDSARHNALRLAPLDRPRSDLLGRKLTTQADSLLREVIRKYPGTPWEALARQALAVPPGLGWEALRLDEATAR